MGSAVLVRCSVVTAVHQNTSDGAMSSRTSHPRNPSRLGGTRVRRAAGFALPVGVAVATSQTWFKPGHFIAQGDIAPFVRTSVAAEYTWAWNHDLSGAGSPTFQIVKAVEVLVIRGVALLGGDEVAAQRLFYALLLALVAVGAASFARCFTSNWKAIALAGTFACLNAFVLNQVPNPLVLAAIGLMGISGFFVVRAAQGARVSPIVLAAVSVGFSYLLINAPVFAVAALWVVALVGLGTAFAGPGGTKRAAWLVLRALPWAVALNLWWIVPAIPTFLGGSAPEVAVSTDVRAWSWTHVRSSIGNVLALTGMWTWSYREYVPSAPKLDRSWWAWLAFVPALASLAAPVVATARHRRQSLVLLSGALVLVLVGKGVHPPLSGLNYWFYDHVPGFWLLREPMAKVGPPLVLVYAALIAIGLTSLVERHGARPARRSSLGPIALAVAAAATVAFPYPLWNGTLIPDDKPVLPSAHVRLPDGWRAAADHLNGEPLRGKALVLPLNDFYQVPTTWGYYGVDVIPSALLRRPTIQPLPENYFVEPQSYMAAARGLQRGLIDGDIGSVPRLLQALGVSHVVVRHDLDRDFPGRSFADPDRIEESLAASPSLRHARSFGVADVYTVDAPSALVQVREPEGSDLEPSALPELSWHRQNPTRYAGRVSGANGPFLLTLAESFDAGWRLSGVPDGVSASHQRVDGYANGWLVDGAGTFDLTVQYAPARRARWALGLSWLAGGAAVAASAYGTARSILGRRRARAHEEPVAEVPSG